MKALDDDDDDYVKEDWLCLNFDQFDIRVLLEGRAINNDIYLFSINKLDCIN